MKKNILYLGIAALLLGSCFKAHNDSDTGKGFLSENIRLAGQDTLTLAVGSKGNTNTAFLDGSSQPVTFTIANVRDEAGNRMEEFFKSYPYTSWVKPYDILTDRTEEDVLAKLQTVDKAPVLVNPVNGQLQYLETTSNLTGNEGDVYHLDVLVENIAGSRMLTDYAILKMGPKSRPFSLDEAIVGIAMVTPSGTQFPYYDQINSSNTNFVKRRTNIYADNGQEKYFAIRQLPDEPDRPEFGVKVYIRFHDQNGKPFDAKQMATYSEGTKSYIDASVTRENTNDGIAVTFPVTPWPVATDFMSYLKGPTYDLAKLDVAQMTIDKNANDGPYDENFPSLWWPEDDDFSAYSSWYVRMRSKIWFYEAGTWEIVMTFPYTDITK